MSFQKTVFIALAVLQTACFAIDKREAAYIGNNTDIGGTECSWSFISRFSFELYSHSQASMFREYNDWYIDDFDIVYSTSHGNMYHIYDNSGKSIYMGSAGNTSHKGYGDAGVGCKFLVLHTCSTVPSVLERADWWKPWISDDNTDIFDGLHQVLGFRSSAYGSSAAAVSGYFADKVRGGSPIWQSWFEAITKKGATEWVFWPIKKRHKEFGCVVLDEAAQNDTYDTWCAKPSSTSTTLYHWYQY